MAEFEDKLNAILADPAAMGQILSVAKALTGEGGGAEDAPPADPPAGPAPAEAAPPPETAKGEQGDLSALLGLLGGGGEGLDPRLLQAAVTLFSEYSATDDRKVALLNALIPFLKEERRAKVEQAVKIARLAHVIRVALRLFIGNEEVADHV